MEKFKEYFKPLNGRSLLGNIITLIFTIIGVGSLGLVWLLQMSFMYLTFPPHRKFKFWKKEEWKIETHYPNQICHILCNAEENFARHIIRFREYLEPEWCVIEEDRDLTHEQIHEKYN